MKNKKRYSAIVTVTEKRLHGSHKILFLYWFILVLWQNIGGQQARSNIDIVIKIGLIASLVLYFFSKSLCIQRKALIYFLIIALSMAATFFLDNVYNINVMISYIFPLLFIFLTYCIGKNQKICVEEYIQYLHWVILVVLYMIVYSFIFCREKFTSISTISTAYGNELSSFLISNLEYGMYLTFAIFACLICMHCEKKVKYRKVFYSIIIILCFINLLFTYSRTSIIASIAAVVIYIFAGNRKIMPYFFVICIIVALILSTNEKVSVFVNDIVFKGGTASGRDTMIQIAISEFSNGTFVEKLFGRGYGRGGEMIRVLTEHGSLHNGFLQLLIVNGIVGLAIVVIFLIYNIISAIRFISFNKFWGGIFLALSCMPVFFMMTNTSIIFYSSIDSAMLTIFTIIVPKYFCNAVKYN